MYKWKQPSRTQRSRATHHAIVGWGRRGWLQHRQVFFSDWMLLEVKFQANNFHEDTRALPEDRKGEVAGFDKWGLRRMTVSVKMGVGMQYLTLFSSTNLSFSGGKGSVTDTPDGNLF